MSCVTRVKTQQKCYIEAKYLVLYCHQIFCFDYNTNNFNNKTIHFHETKNSFYLKSFFNKLNNINLRKKEVLNKQNFLTVNEAQKH